MLDPALDTLFLPLATGALTWPRSGEILFLRARMGQALLDRDVPRDRFLCRQSFLPFAKDLALAHFPRDHGPEAPDGPFPLVLALPPRQRDEARFVLAQAVARAASGSTVVAAATNNEGARSMESDLAELAGNVASLSKHKARVFWARIYPATVNRPLLQEWLALGAPRRLAEDARFLSRPGLFAWDRIDAGSALLARHLPGDLAGHGADLGCGFGYLSAEVLAHCPKVTALDLYEAERVALDLACENVTPLGHGVRLDFLWHDVTTGLRASYDFIVSNPPFHTGRADRVDLGQGFIVAGAKALKPGGRMFIVANRHLPYEATISAYVARHRVLAVEGGYKIIEAVNIQAVT
ncbi:class I SAM-dependent methyltransferase [Dongia sp.]|uniref:class I SAM-dependent methyltransferase n=1 Tax=Dongia sp. TaxID=1977262 RepID=UPI0035B289FA